MWIVRVQLGKFGTLSSEEKLALKGCCVHYENIGWDTYIRGESKQGAHVAKRVRTYLHLDHTVKVARCTVRDQDEIVDSSFCLGTRKAIDDRLNNFR